MDKFNTHHVTMGIKKSMKQQNSKQKRHIAPKSKEFRSWILRKVIDNGKNNSLNIWILDNPKIWGTHLNRREVVMRIFFFRQILLFFWTVKSWFITYVFVLYKLFYTHNRSKDTGHFNAKSFQKCTHRKRGGSHFEWTASLWIFSVPALWNSYCKKGGR